jgi:hypothetical protein
MTNIIKYTALFLLISLSCCTVAQQITFEKNYDFGYADVAYCVQQTPDSGFIAAGRQGIAPFYEKMVILKTDKYGNEQWNKIIGTGSNSAWANYIVNCTNGGYAAVGYQYDANYRYDVFLVRLDNNGDTLWTKHFGTTAFNEKGNCIKETVNKGFVISFIQSTPDTTGFLILDSIGNLILEKKYQLFDGAAFYNMNTLSDGGFIACGVAQSDNATHGIIIRTDSLGDSLWVKKFIGTNGAEFYETQQTTDNSIIIGGTSYTASLGQWNGYFIKLNLNGDTIWTKNYPIGVSSYIKSIHQCNDGSYIAVGSVFHFSPPNPSDGNQNIYLLKLDSLGDLIWTKEFGALAEDEGGYYVRQSYDSGYIVTGVLDPGNFYLLKIDEGGNLSTGVQSFINNAFALKVYPNPTNDVLFISLKPNLYNLLLTNNQGQILFQLDNFTNNSTSIDLSLLPNGIYFLQIQSNNFTLTEKIIKIN